VSRDGRDQLLRRLRFYRSAEFRDLAGSLLYEYADQIRAEAFRSISAGSVSGKNHIPSAPNTPPNRDTGALQAGLEVQRTGPLTAEVRAETPYSAPLEFGSSKVAARPFMRPARDKVAAVAEQEFARKLAREVRRRTRG
jgi:HK97 gp10 family phage protein